MAIDINGREVMVGDLLRIFHFTTPRRRKVYLYKIAVRTNADRQIRPDGEFWYAVDTSEIATKGLADAWKHLIQPDDKFEIIDGLGDQESRPQPDLLVGTAKAGLKSCRIICWSHCRSSRRIWESTCRFFHSGWR